MCPDIQSRMPDPRMRTFSLLCVFLLCVSDISGAVVASNTEEGLQNVSEAECIETYEAFAPNHDFYGEKNVEFIVDRCEEKRIKEIEKGKRKNEKKEKRRRARKGRKGKKGTKDQMKMNKQRRQETDQSDQTNETLAKGETEVNPINLILEPETFIDVKKLKSNLGRRRKGRRQNRRQRRKQKV